MPSRKRALARRCHRGIRRRTAVLLALTPFLASLAVGVASADNPPAVTSISADDLARAGNQIGLVRHSLGGTSVVELVLPARSTSRQLAIAADGTAAALADQYGPLAALLTVARADGSQTRVNLPGLLGAGFAPDGAWLATIDGRGALWRIVTQSGSAILLADGPFVGSPIVAGDGSILLLAVPSVSAPISSTLVRLDPESGSTEALSADRLVYAAFPLADGGLALAAHEVGRTVVRRLVGNQSELVADLGPGAVDVTVAPDGQRIAFARGRDVIYLPLPGGSAGRLGTGSSPRFAPDGSALMILDGGTTRVLALDGSELASYDAQAGFVACAAGCGS
jgi:WD40-like Beta Propeller Repeat